MKYMIEVKEYLSKTIEIEAKSLEDAILHTKQMYVNEELILDDTNFVCVEIEEADLS